MTSGRQHPTEPAAAGVPVVGQGRSLLSRPDAQTQVVPLPMRSRGLVSTAGIVAQGLVRFGYSVIIGRSLPAGFLSATNSAISTALLASLLWPTSLGAAAAKFLARESADPERRAGLMHHLGSWCLATSGLLAVAAGLVTWLWLAPGQAGTAVLVGLLTVGWSTYTYVRSAHYATQRVLRATVGDVAALVVAVSGLLVVLAAGATDLILVPITVGYLGYAVLGWPRGRRTVLSAELRAEIRGFVGWGVVGSLTTAGFLQLTMVIARQTGDLRGADAYAAALTLATPASMVSSVLSLILLPALSGAVGRGDVEEARRQTDLAHRGLIVLIGAAFGALVLGARAVVDVVWPDLEGAVPVLQILLLASFLLTSATACTESLNSMDPTGPRTVGTVRLVGFAVGLAVLSVSVGTGSVTGIALGYLCGMAVVGLVPFALVWWRQGQRWRGFTVRVTTGCALVGGLETAREQWSPHGGTDLVAVAAFLLLWAALFGGETARILRPGAGDGGTRSGVEATP